MMSDLLIVFDTNVLVSALLAQNSIPQRALEKALRTGHLAQSLDTLNELRTVLERRKFDKYLTREERLQFLAMLVRESILITVTESISASRDAKDDKFLALALACGARFIVSGDDDLLSLHPFQDVTILSPKAFLEAEI